MSEQPQDTQETKKTEQKPEQAEKIRIMAKAMIEWKDKDGKVTGEESYWRGAVALLQYLDEKLQLVPQLAESTIKIYLKPMNAEDHEEIVLAEGKLEQVIAKLQERCMPSVHAIAQLQLIISQMAEFSPLKGIIITSVFEDAQAFGFGFTSESCEVTEADIKVLVSAAEGQVNLFKDKMRSKMNIQFDGDKGQIIIPGSGRTIPNLHIAR